MKNFTYYSILFRFLQKKFFLMSNKIKILQMILNSIFKILDKVQSTGIKR